MRLASLSASAGVFLCLQLSHLPSFRVVIFTSLLLILVLWRWPWLRMAVASLMAGFIFTLIVVKQEQQQQLHLELLGRDITLTGRISGVPEQDIRRTNFNFDVATIRDDLPFAFTSQNLRLNWYGYPPPLNAGEQWQLTVRLKQPRSLGNPGGFDYARWLFQERIHAVGYVRESPAAIKLVDANSWRPDSVRSHLFDALASLPNARAEIALVQALTLGITHSVEEAQWRGLRDSGTAHLLAISGLHIGLIAGWAYYLGSLLWNVSASRLSRQSFSLMAGIVAACLYAAMAGFGLPTQRALLMLLIVAIAGFYSRAIPPASGLLLALLVVLIIDPLSILSAGFWLSFGTVALLFYLHAGRLQRIAPVWQALSVHVKLGLVLLPVTAWFFNSGAAVAPLANAIAVPLVGFLIVPLALLTLLLTVVWPELANCLLVPTQWLLQYLLESLNWLTRQVQGSLSLAMPSAEVLLYCLAGLLVFFAPRGLRLRWLALPLCLPALVFNVQGARISDFELHVLDVGQGLAAFVFTQDQTLLFDTGGWQSPARSMVDGVIMKFLHSQGRKHIDVLVVSHADSDHAAGAADIRRHFPDVKVYASDQSPESLNPSTFCAAGQSWQWNNVYFSFVHPASTDFGTRNDLSCVLLVHSGKSRALLTGDIEAQAETRLAERLGDFPVTVMTSPHHGSSTSSTQELLDVLRPQYVVFPAGYKNAFGFPHQDVQMRYTLLGARAHTTGIDGALSFRFGKQGLKSEPTAYWHDNRRFWHRNSE